MYDPEFIEERILKPLDVLLEQGWWVEVLKKVAEKATGKKELGVLDPQPPDDSQHTI